ncbi:hypothetical protein [Mycolicibacterium sphagni]|uniref:hypothetical protein n=1 Tax=Mycolicibacterium sphagni TaxID=1786 RepID=UPI0021F2E536|nr:hypothetical protein [Mycolicibacterium sphagni]MCV7174946.1 hypothetical protein [Mycolicibacterium sphagni]
MAKPQPAAPQPDEPVVKKVADWHLVEHSGWQVSVGPDGLIMLPRHLTPEEVADFCAAATAASRVGAQVRADNEARAAGDNRTPVPRTRLTGGATPAGHAKAIVKATGTPAPRSSIGRRRGTAAKPR